MSRGRRLVLVLLALGAGCGSAANGGDQGAVKCAQAQTAAGGAPCGYVSGNFVACSAGGQWH